MVERFYSNLSAIGKKYAKLHNILNNFSFISFGINSIQRIVKGLIQVGSDSKHEKLESNTQRILKNPN